MDRIIETDQSIIRTNEVILEGESLERICDQIRILEVKIIEVDTEEFIEMILMKEAEVDLGIDSIPIIPERMIEVVKGINQFPDLVPIEIELDAINVENMIILLRTVKLQK